MTPFVELLNSALKQGMTYGVFVLLFCLAALYADAQGHLQLASIGPGARTTVILGLIAAVIVTLIAAANRSAAVLGPKARAFHQTRKKQANANAALAAADAEVLANYQVLPEREKLLLALVMHKGNQRFHIAKPTKELLGLFSKYLVHLPQGARARDVFIVRENIWALKDTLLEEMQGPVKQHLLEAKDPGGMALRGAWTSELEL